MKFAEKFVRICFDPESLTFVSEVEYQAFLAAVGRQVLFGAAGQPDGSAAMSLVGIDASREIIGSHYRTVQRPGFDESWSASKFAQVENPWRQIYDVFYTEGRPFVMGAIPREGGKYYSFHS